MIKTITAQVKAGPADGLDEYQFTAYASVFGNIDAYGDVVVQGAFADDLKAWEGSGQLIPLLFGHNTFDPDFNIGSVDAQEDDHGLLVKGTLDPDSPKAMTVYRLIKGRRLNQMSFSYDVIDGGPVTKDSETFYELRKLKLFEVSVVPIGANQETEILAVKAAAEQLASGVKAGRVISAKNESSLRSARDAIDSVLAALDSAEDSEKASGAGSANSAKAPEEPSRNPSVDSLAMDVLDLEMSIT